jgi:multicomponent Na+:H+ antiporter subunit D
VLPVTGFVFTLAACGLAGLPPFGSYLGTGWIAASAASRGLAWIAVILVGCSALTGAAVLRAAGGVFYGLGDAPAEDPQMAVQASEEKTETTRARRRTPVSMIVPAALLTLTALAPAFIPRLEPAIQAMAARLQDQRGYASGVLSRAAEARALAATPPVEAGIWIAAVTTGVASAACAIMLAWLALYGRRLRPHGSGPERSLILVRAFERVQSGVINDYVTWIVVGVACIGAVLAFAIG